MDAQNWKEHQDKYSNTMNCLKTPMLQTVLLEVC